MENSASKFQEIIHSKQKHRKIREKYSWPLLWIHQLFFGNKFGGYPETKAHTLCCLSITFLHVFVFLGKKALRLLDGNISKVYFGNMYKVIPDLNNVDIQSIAHPAEQLVPLTREGYLAVQNDEFNSVQGLSLSLPSSDTCSCHCPGDDLTCGYWITLIKLKETEGLCQNDNYWIQIRIKLSSKQDTSISLTAHSFPVGKLCRKQNDERIICFCSIRIRVVSDIYLHV